MSGINKVILVGNLGQDPEIRYIPSGTAVCTLSLATSETWRDKQTGENKELTEWHRVVLWGKVAEVAAEYLRKGSKVYIEGALRTQKWKDDAGNDRYTTEVVVSGNKGTMQMLGNASGNQQSGQPQRNQNQNRPAQQQAQQQPQQQQQFSGQPQQAQSAANTPMDFDDDIPF